MPLFFLLSFSLLPPLPLTPLLIIILAPYWLPTKFFLYYSHFVSVFQSISYLTVFKLQELKFHFIFHHLLLKIILIRGTESSSDVSKATDNK